MYDDLKQADEPKKIYILDRSPVVLVGLTEVIESSPGIKVAWSGVEAPKLFEAVEQQAPDLIVLDLLLHNCDGLEVIKQLTSRWPDLPILVVASLDERVYCDRAIRAGAHGFIMKTESTENLKQSVAEVLKGEVYLSDNIKKSLIHSSLGKKKNNASPLDTLSDRELEVFSLLGEGLSTKKIAARLGLSSKTIDTYRIQIKEKLQINKVNELVMLASHWTVQRAKSPGVEAVPFEKAG